MEERIRQQKTGRIIQKEIATLLTSVFQGIGKGSLITVTVVRMSPDLSLAKVYLSIFGNANKEGVLAEINDLTGRIRFELGKKIRNQMRIVPELAWFIDDSLDHAERINQLLKK